jgi:hypothetical protein
MIFCCPLCQESEWVEDEDEDSDDDEELVFDICEFCLLDEGLYFTLGYWDICGYLQDAYFFCEDKFLQEVEVA